jgi:hypothetical protein
MNYATIDKELLCVIATLHKFCSMMLGAELYVHTDQKILELNYVEGPHNVIAGTFSRLLRSYVSSPLVGKKAANVVSDSESNNRNESSHSLIMNDKDIVDCLMNLPCLPSRKKKDRRATKHRKCTDEQNKFRFSSHRCDSTVEQCYPNLPEDMFEDNPLDLENIKEIQDHDEKLMQSAVKHPEWYSCKSINDVEDILCYTKPGGEKLHYLRT